METSIEGNGKTIGFGVKQANERGREEGREEKEAEIRSEMAGYDEKKQLENQATLSEKLKAAMDEMQRDHAEKLAIQEAKLRAQQEEAAVAAEKVVDMQVAFEREKTDALIEAESALRGRLALEWTERLQQEVATALEQEIAKHEEMHREVEQSWHDKMTELTSQFESERANWHVIEAQKLQETILAAEERLQAELKLALARGQQEKEQQLQVELFAIENRSDAEIYELKMQLKGTVLNHKPIFDTNPHFFPNSESIFASTRPSLNRLISSPFNLTLTYSSPVLKASQEHASANAHWQGEFLKHVEESEKMLKKLEKARHAEHKRVSNRTPPYHLIYFQFYSCFHNDLKEPVLSCTNSLNPFPNPTLTQPTLTLP